jgi:GrpB-like predicted nucleotidyltransferase (UPF0157 family)
MSSQEPDSYEQRLAAVTIGPLEPLDGPVSLSDYDPRWPVLFEREAQRMRAALGNEVKSLEHVGSTSVAGLIAKPIIDIVLAVEDPAREIAYVPALETAGYVLRIREPHWHQHRLFKGPDTDINAHVFAAGSSEIERMVRFRDHLRTDPDARAAYGAAKRALAARRWRYVQEYADAKTGIVESILDRTKR